MHVQTQPAALIANDGMRARIGAILVLALITVSVLMLLWPSSAAMIDTWQHSSTYGHCYLVVPVALWMAWRESRTLVSTPFEPLWPALVLVAAFGFVWLMGQLASAAVVSQFAAIALIIATVLSLFGWTWTRQWAFPLAFLFFAVPFGEGLLPLLMEWTADVTVWALRASGIPVYREGNYFVVPSGSWSVVEACGGVRFLIAALMTGCIFAWLQYRSPAKRIVFIFGAVVIALVANWLRAYAMVIMGHLSDNRIGTGADHNVWGWLIFGAAMFALLALGMRWTDPLAVSVAQRRNPERTRVVPVRAIFQVWVASLIAVAVWPVAAARIEQRVDARSVQIEPIAQSGGWRSVPTNPAGWTPELTAPSAVTIQSFVRDDHPVSVFLGVYRNQRQGAEVVSALNQIAGSTSRRWRVLDRGSAEVSLNGKATPVETALVRGADEQLLIWHWYWTGGRATTSDLTVTAQLALQRLTGAPDDAAWVAVFTPIGEDASSGERRLAGFTEAMSASIDAALRTTAAR